MVREPRVFYNNDDATSNGGAEPPNDLEGITPEDLDSEKIKLGDAEVSVEELAEIYKNYKNDNAWKTDNNKRGAELNTLERNLKAQKEEIERKEAELRMIEQSIYNKQQSAIPVQPQLNPYAQNTYEDIEDPHIVAMMKRLDSLATGLSSFQKQYDTDRFIGQINTEHGALRSKHSDYDPVTVENELLKGRNKFEDVYKAMKYDAMVSGGDDAIKQIIPPTLLQQLEKEIRAKLIEEIRDKKNNKKKVESQPPSKSALSHPLKDKANTYTELTKNVLQDLADEKLTLTE
jgi:hypothetical protein